MTINETIRKFELDNEIMSSAAETIPDLLIPAYEANKTAIKAMRQNIELKRLLKLALDEMIPGSCEKCKHKAEKCNFPCCYSDKSRKIEWSHADEVKGVLKDA